MSSQQHVVSPVGGCLSHSPVWCGAPHPGAVGRLCGYLLLWLYLPAEHFQAPPQPASWLSSAPGSKKPHTSDNINAHKINNKRSVTHVFINTCLIPLNSCNDRCPGGLERLAGNNSLATVFSSLLPVFQQQFDKGLHSPTTTLKIDTHTHVHSHNGFRMPTFHRLFVFSLLCLKTATIIDRKCFMYGRVHIRLYFIRSRAHQIWCESSIRINTSVYRVMSQFPHPYFSTIGNESIINTALLSPIYMFNLPPAVALVSPHQTLSWPPPEPLREEHFWACQPLHLSVRLQVPGASAPQHPGSWWSGPARLHAAVPGSHGQSLPHVAFLRGVWHAGQWARQHVCAAQAPEPAAAPGAAPGAYIPAGGTHFAIRVA